MRKSTKGHVEIENGVAVVLDDEMQMAVFIEAVVIRERTGEVGQSCLRAPRLHVVIRDPKFERRAVEGVRRVNERDFSVVQLVKTGFVCRVRDVRRGSGAPRSSAVF